MDWSNDSQTVSNIYKTSLGVRDVEGCFIGKTNLLLIQKLSRWWSQSVVGTGERKRPCRKKYMRNSVNRSTKTWIISLSLMKCTAEFFSTSVHSSQIFYQICQDCSYWIPLRIWHLSAFHESFVCIYFDFHGFLHRQKTLLLLVSLLWWPLINHTSPKHLCSLSLSFGFCPITLYIIFSLSVLRGTCYKTY